MPRLLRISAFLLLALAMLPLRMTAQAPKGVPSINQPCGANLPEDTVCIQAAIRLPAGTQPYSITPTASATKYTFEATAERERPAYFYVLRPDDSLVNQIAYETLADLHGIASFELNVALLGPGEYRIVAYYLASRDDAERDESFYELTGTPLLSFRIPQPVAVVEDPPDPPVVPLLDCDMADIFPIDGITYGRKCAGTTNNGVCSTGGTLYVMSKADETETSVDAARITLMQSAIDELAYQVCTHPLVKTDYTSGFESVLKGNGVMLRGDSYDAFSVPDSALYMSRAEIAAAVDAISSNCPADPSPLHEQVGDILNVFLNWDSSTYNPTNADRPCEFCDGWKICYNSGISPLLFLSSDVPIDARVDVQVTGGRVSESRPQMDPDGWRTHVGPDATTRPLYYEYTSPFPAAPVEGWSVSTQELASFLRMTLISWGYDAIEVDAFIRTDVLPRIPTSPFVEVHVLDRATVDALLPLSVTPTPVHIERVHFLMTPTANPRPLVSPLALRYHDYAGFSVREFGAIILPSL